MPALHQHRDAPGTGRTAPGRELASPDSQGSGATERRTERPLRVALFTDNYGPGHSGLLYAVQFIEGELLKCGHRVLVVAPQAKGPNPYKDAPGRREMRLPSLLIPGFPARVASGTGFEKALEEFEKDPPDIIHVHGLGPIGMLGVWAADRCDVPLITTWHTDFEAYASHYSHLTPFLDAYYRLLRVSANGMNRPSLKDMRQWVSKWPRRGISRRSLLGAARDMLEASELVTTPSDKTAVRVRELAPHSRIRVVPNGADALPPHQPLAQPPGPRIIYVGRIAPEKGIGLLLEAFEWVREEVPDAELMVVGDWRKSQSLKQKLSRARRRGGVTLVGQVPRDRLRPYYESADVFAFPSLTDTQALVLHEAAHAGLPIVSVDHELRLVIDEGVNGLFARPTPESFARALVSMLRKLKDPDFKARAQARSHEMAGWWTIDHQSEEIVRLYEDLAACVPIEERMNAVPPDETSR
ncbi:glycosyltransferase [Nigerium massiliense]|uniref:glycosyltransferase n=1 Tax=Nigerium massiliense TaxID=1522317 RepID=UPI00058F1788|nr:glycosyltransferase [Nigerium massiliense]